MADHSIDSTANARAASAKILLVDDDRALCEMLAEYLAVERFQVAAAHDGRAGVERVRAEDFDAVVMDITMPVLDGFEALRRLRRFSAVPVLMLTARGDAMDRIVGLELGADDYLAKPFNPRELSARLKAILRRVRGSSNPDPDGHLSVADLTLQPGAQAVQVAGQPVPLTATEYGLLAMLVRAAGSVVRKEAVCETVLGRRLTPYDRSLDTHMANLRRKLGPGPDGKPRIKTLRGQGYLLVTG